MISKLIKHLHLQFQIPAFNQYHEPVKHSQRKALKLILTLLTGFLLNTLFLCIYIRYNNLMILNENKQGLSYAKLRLINFLDPLQKSPCNTQKSPCNNISARCVYHEGSIADKRLLTVSRSYHEGTNIFHTILGSFERKYQTRGMLGCMLWSPTCFCL